MSLTVQDGRLVVRNGALGTTQACCCGGCSGPCESNGDCAPGCVCVDGECVTDACEPGYECIGTADCTLFGYCEQVDGEWMWSGAGGGGGVIPCPECPDGWTTFMNEGPAPWDPEVTLRFYTCITSKPADYATCCSPNAPRFENGNLSECETDGQFQQDTTADGAFYLPCNWGYGCEEILLP